MCHSDAPEGAEPRASTQEVAIPLPSGESMPALFATPLDAASPAARPVLVISDMFGRSPFYDHLGRRLAEAGFSALVVDYFFRLGPLAEHSAQAGFARRRELDERASLYDLRAALGWLRERPQYAGSIGTIGFCMGGTFGLDLAALDDDLATVAYYGFPVPQATLASPPPAPIELVAELRGPILAFWGDQDEIVGLDNVTHFVEQMRTTGQADFAHRVFPGVGHGFLGVDLDTADEQARNAVTESWSATVDFLRARLR